MLTLEFKKDNDTKHLNIMSAEQPNEHGYNVCFWDYKKDNEKFKYIDYNTYWNTFNVSYKDYKIETFKSGYLIYSKDCKKSKYINKGMLFKEWLDVVILNSFIH